MRQIYIYLISAQAQLLAQHAAKDSGGVVSSGPVEWAPMDTAEPAPKPAE